MSFCPFFNYSHTHTQRGNHRHVLDGVVVYVVVYSQFNHFTSSSQVPSP